MLSREWQQEAGLAEGAQVGLSQKVLVFVRTLAAKGSHKPNQSIERSEQLLRGK